MYSKNGVRMEYGEYSSIQTMAARGMLGLLVLQDRWRTGRQYALAHHHPWQGVILDRLDSLGLTQDTIVMVFGDHGCTHAPSNASYNSRHSRNSRYSQYARYSRYSR